MRKILLVVLVAFLLRVYPYSHYPYLLTNDAMRDFQQVQFLQENQGVNWEHAYGRNPTLHVVVYLVSLIGGAEAWGLNLLIPQLISSLGVLFFYMFLRGYVGERHALISSFFLATFGPNIWWGSQAVRETVGLFYFPFVLYAFDRFVGGGGRRLLILALSFLTMLVTHNLTTALAIGVLGVLALTRYQSARAIVAAGSGAVLMVLYWKWKFAWYYGWLADWSFLKLLAFLFGVAVLYSVGRWCRQKETDKVKSAVGRSDVLLVAAYILVFFVAVGYLQRLLVFAYPPQQYLSIFLLGLFFALGVSKMGRYHVNMVMANMPLLALLVVGLYVGTYTDFDATRVVEYLVYPNAVVAAIGFNAVTRNKSIKCLLIGAMIISGLLIYPPVFILGKQISQNSTFYDVRSHIRYIPGEGMGIMEWGQENGYIIISVNPNFNDLRDVSYPVDGQLAFLVSDYDYRVLESLDKVQVRSLGIGSPEGVIEASKTAEEIYGNDWGTVYGWNENISEKEVFGEYVSWLRTR